MGRAWARACWRPETGIFLAVWLLLLVGGRGRLFRDPGTFWHTVVGRQMLERGQLIYTDEFSFTFHGQPWSPHQWLGEIVMALLHRAGGLDTLLLTTVTVLAGLSTWLAHRLIRAGLHWSLAAVVVVLAVAVSAAHFHIRPHIGTIVFLAITFAFLADFEAGRIGLARLFWLVPLFALWSAIHGGMLGGLGTLGLAVAGWGAFRLVGWPSPVVRGRQVILLGLLILGCGLTALANPYDPPTLIPRIWGDIMKADLPQIIVEHRRLDPGKPEDWLVVSFGVFYAGMLLSVWPMRPRVIWLLPLVWFYLACGRIRHAPLFAVTATLALADILPHTYWAHRLSRAGSDLFRIPSEGQTRTSRFAGWAAWLLPAVAVATAFGLQISGAPLPLRGGGWARLDPAYWPVELLPALRRAEQGRPEGTPIFNEFLHGGFLIYHTPGLRVFVDDRCELYGDDWLKEYVAAETHDTAGYLARMEERYGPFDLALTRTDSGFDRYFHNSPDWERIQRGQAGALYQRKKDGADKIPRNPTQTGPCNP